jgi:hypothetical protein
MAVRRLARLGAGDVRAMRLPVERVRRGAPGEPRPDSNARGEAECAVCAPPKKAATIDLACQTLSGYEIVWG